MRVLKEVRQHIRNYHLKSGIFHFYRGEYKRAADFLTRALEEAESLAASERRTTLYFLVQARIGAAKRHLAAGEPELGIAEFRAALEVMPGYADVHARLGEALTGIGDFEGAREHFGRAIEINPRFVDAWVRLGETLLRLEREADAREAFRRALEARDAVARTKIENAERALDAGRGEEAAQIYGDAFRSNLEDFRARFEAGLAALRHEKWDDAVEALEHAARLCPRFADVRNYLGVALAERGSLDDACREFAASVNINPDYVVAWLNLAFSKRALDDEQSARDALHEVLEREPDNAPAAALLEELERERPPESLRHAARFGQGGEHGRAEEA